MECQRTGEQPVSHRKNLLFSSQELLSTPFVLPKKAPTPTEQTEEKVDRTAKKKFSHSQEEIKTRKAIDNAKKIETSNSQKINTRKAVTPKVQQQEVPPSIEKTEKKEDTSKKVNVVGKNTPFAANIPLPSLPISIKVSIAPIPKRKHKRTGSDKKDSDSNLTTKALVSPRLRSNTEPSAVKSCEEKADKRFKSCGDTPNPLYHKITNKKLKALAGKDGTMDGLGLDTFLKKLLIEEFSLIAPPEKSCTLKEMKANVDNFWLKNTLNSEERENSEEGDLLETLQSLILIPDSIDYVTKLQAKFFDTTGKNKAAWVLQMSKFFEELVGPYTPQKNEGEKESPTPIKERKINFNNFVNVNKRIKALVKETHSKELGQLLKKILPYKNKDELLEYIKTWNYGVASFKENRTYPTSFEALPVEDILRSIMPDNQVLPNIIINNLFIRSGQKATRKEVVKKIIYEISASCFRKDWLESFYIYNKECDEEKEILDLQVKVILCLGSVNKDEGPKFLSEMNKFIPIKDENILIEKINWKGLESLFLKKFEYNKINWRNIQKEMESLKLKMDSKRFIIELTRRLVPSLDILQFFAVNSLFQPSRAYGESFPVLIEKDEKKEKVCSLNCNDRDIKNTTCKVDVCENGFKIYKSFLMGLFEIDPSFPNSKETKLANLYLTFNVNSTDLYTAHTGSYICTSMDLTPKIMEKGQDYVLNLIKRIQGTNFTPMRLKILSPRG